ncbi:MAG: hypothetical protein OEM59_18900 [Rhodospirillales bacterium]|nr:hypothetical protein [Rhodospirillales bacterium]
MSNPTRQGTLGLLSFLVLAALGARPASAQEILPELARVGPWPVASRLIGYGDRLWLASSVKGVNHNSAELYSYDPRHGDLRYERHLFSQDAGQPLVFGGLLYWPFEDSRFSLGWGHFMVTDGVRWRLGTIPTARIFHVHALAALDGRLVAATSAWRAGLQASPDGSLHWQELYDHPTAERRVSRLTELFALPGMLVGSLREPAGRRLVVFDGAGLRDLPGWPKGRPVLGLTAHEDILYGLVEEEEGVALWRSDGATSVRLSAPRASWRPRGLAVGADGFWSASAEAAGGLVWHSAEGRDWRVRHRLAGGAPREIALYGGRLYVAGAGDDGRGILWGPAPPAPREPTVGPAAAMTALDLLGQTISDQTDWTALGDALDRALEDPASYEGGGRAAIRDLVYRAVLAGPPAGFFTARLARRFPERELSLIGGAASPSAAELGRWILLWGMALARRGFVPPELIAAPWRRPPNRAEKYFGVAPAAIWAAAEIGQDDRATIAALIGRLGRAGDPEWLTGDAVGALTTLTGRRFGFDQSAWRAWWAAEQENWPE